MSESVTRALSKHGGNIRWLVTILVAGSVYYAGIEVTKANVESQAAKLKEMERKAADDHDLLIEIRAEQKAMRNDLIELKGAILTNNRKN